VVPLRLRASAGKWLGRLSAYVLSASPEFFGAARWQVVLAGHHFLAGLGFKLHAGAFGDSWPSRSFSLFQYFLAAWKSVCWVSTWMMSTTEKNHVSRQNGQAPTESPGGLILVGLAGGGAAFTAEEGLRELVQVPVEHGAGIGRLNAGA